MKLQKVKALKFKRLLKAKSVTILFLFFASLFLFSMDNIEPVESNPISTWKVQAATSWSGDKAYFFNGNKYFRYEVASAKVDPKYPLPISGQFASGWPSGWTSVDAAANIGTDKVYLFKGSQYIRYDANTGKVASGYPKPIKGMFSKNWPSGWTSVDAAVNLDNGNIYFFRGKDYIRYNIESATVTDPKPILYNFAGSWPSWNSVDAAVNYGNGTAYFFKGDQYFRYTINGAKTSAPQKACGNFVHCASASSASPVSTIQNGGTYRIRLKADNQYMHADGLGDKLISTRYQETDDFTRFIFQKQSDGSYRIRVKATGLYLHEDGWGDKLISTRYQETDDFTRFIFEKQSDGSFRIKVKADNRYLHLDGLGDKKLSTRHQTTDDYSRFFLEASK